MALYESKKSYKLLGKAVSIINISLQIYILSQVLTLAMGVGWQIVSVAIAYFITDLCIYTWIPMTIMIHWQVL